MKRKFKQRWDRHGSDRMVVGFTTTYALSAITFQFQAVVFLESEGER
jgi:hypothetical protein